jgi:hypothetical protein
MQKDNSNVSKKESPLFQPKCQINFQIFLDQVASRSSKEAEAGNKSPASASLNLYKDIAQG